MSPRKPSSQELTREMIINEAGMQFMEKDFRQGSMRSIAKELGCSHGAIYYYFKNKAELFYVIIAEYFAELNKLLDEAVAGTEDYQTKLNRVFLGFMEFGLTHQPQYEYMFMLRSKEVDGLSQEAANLSFEKFVHKVLF